MDIKKIKVMKNGVTKEVEARQEKDYIKAGWTVITETPNIFKSTFTTPNYIKK